MIKLADIVNEMVFDEMAKPRQQITLTQDQKDRITPQGREGSMRHQVGTYVKNHNGPISNADVAEHLNVGNPVTFQHYSEAIRMAMGNEAPQQQPEQGNDVPPPNQGNNEPPQNNDGNGNEQNNVNIPNNPGGGFEGNFGELWVGAAYYAKFKNPNATFQQTKNWFYNDVQNTRDLQIVKNEELSENKNIVLELRLKNEIVNKNLFALPRNQWPANNNTVRAAINVENMIANAWDSLTNTRVYRAVSSQLRNIPNQQGVLKISSVDDSRGSDEEFVEKIGKSDFKVIFTNNDTGYTRNLSRISVKGLANKFEDATLNGATLYRMLHQLGLSKSTTQFLISNFGTFKNNKLVPRHQGQGNVPFDAKVNNEYFGVKIWNEFINKVKQDIRNANNEIVNRDGFFNFLKDKIFGGDSNYILSPSVSGFKELSKKDLDILKNSGFPIYVSVGTNERNAANADIGNSASLEFYLGIGNSKVRFMWISYQVSGEGGAIVQGPNSNDPKYIVNIVNALKSWVNEGNDVQDFTMGDVQDWVNDHVDHTVRDDVDEFNPKQESIFVSFLRKNLKQWVKQGVEELNLPTNQLRRKNAVEMGQIENPGNVDSYVVGTPEAIVRLKQWIKQNKYIPLKNTLKKKGLYEINLNKITSTINKKENKSPFFFF